MTDWDLHNTLVRMIEQQSERIDWLSAKVEYLEERVNDLENEQLTVLCTDRGDT